MKFDNAFITENGNNELYLEKKTYPMECKCIPFSIYTNTIITFQAFRQQ